MKHKQILKKHIETLKKIHRHKAHPLLHHIHKKHKISRKTIFYMKEYGPHTNVARTILKESIKILLLASVISSLGGFALENIKNLFITVLPLVILLPVLNDMIGDYGTIVSSRLSTLLHEGKVDGKTFRNKELSKLFMEILLVAMLTTVISCIAALIIAPDHAVNPMIGLKVFLIAIVDVLILVTLLFFIAVYAGRHLYHKQEDPNNFLIPITTSIADFGNMIILALLVMIFF